MDEILKQLQSTFEAGMNTAREEAFAEGREAGIEEGKETGRTEGRKAAFDEVKAVIEKGEPKPFSMSRQGTGGAARTRKNSWEGITPAQRLDRVNAIRRGKGLPIRHA